MDSRSLEFLGAAKEALHDNEIRARRIRGSIMNWKHCGPNYYYQHLRGKNLEQIIEYLYNNLPPGEAFKVQAQLVIWYEELTCTVSPTKKA